MGAPAAGALNAAHRTEARGAVEGAGLHGAEARRWVRLPCEREVEAHAAARGAPALSTQANLVLLIEEGEVVRPQSVVAEDEVRVTVHVKLDKGSLLVKAAQDQQGLNRWNPFYFSAFFQLFPLDIYDKNNWVSHLIILMKVMLLNGITKR